MLPLTRIRVWIVVVFVVGLVVSGVTALPLEAESRLLVRMLHADWSPAPEYLPALVEWIDHVHRGIAATNREFPFLAYGTDWLAFAHLVIAIAFWGPYRDPVRNIWVVHFGMISCAAIIPLALIAGPIRGIPWCWQMIDISFGVLGVIPLLFVHRETRRLAAESAGAAESAPAGAAPDHPRQFNIDPMMLARYVCRTVYGQWWLVTGEARSGAVIKGRFIRFDEVRGYGFITPDNGGEDVFVHANVLGEEKHAFAPGVPVEFEAVESDRGMKALAVRILRTERPAASAVSVSVPGVATGTERGDDDGMCDVLTSAGFRQEVTELLLDAVPTLTGAQIVQLRQGLTGLAQRHGWVEN